MQSNQQSNNQQFMTNVAAMSELQYLISGVLYHHRLVLNLL
jgi:hypothetical protein